MDTLSKILSEQGLAVALLVVFIIQNFREKKSMSKRLTTVEDYQKKELKELTEDSLEMQGKCLSVMKTCNLQIDENTKMLAIVKEKL